MAAQADPRNTEIFGTIKDVAGAVVPGADVQIVTMEGKRLAGGVSNSAGAFRLTIPAIAGATLQITHKGFKPFITSIQVSPAARKPITVVLAIADLSQQINVSATDESQPVST
ncbi:MAG TPA: carboxypeptidase-like regulatory domain-containing protein, partial [Bryobacteraceae bacterium]|nr:carboxypeptidase-like regulatory domain-containing protein [Bryobacteraceae bacterium]HTF70840.1 carboxypeptidase-like regulatory domain-containing protein [Edaphobacter sp.]